MNMKSWRFRSLVGASTIAVSAGLALGVTGVGSEVGAVGANSGRSSAVTPGQTSVAAGSPATAGDNKLTLIGTYVDSGQRHRRGDFTKHRNTS
jgi:hypothetical protein